MIKPWYDSITGGHIWPVRVQNDDGSWDRHFVTVAPLPGVTGLCGAVATEEGCDEGLIDQVARTCKDCGDAAANIRVFPAPAPVDDQEES